MSCIISCVQNTTSASNNLNKDTMGRLNLSANETFQILSEMRYKVDNIGDNIPTEDQLLTVAKSIIRIQAFYDISTDDIIQGTIFGNPSLERLSLDDQYTFARAAYESEEFDLAVDWLLKVISNYANDTDVDFSMTNALNRLSSTYFKVKS